MKASDILLDNGYEDVKIFENYSYDTALIGVTEDNRAVYSYEKMVEWLVETEHMEVMDAIEWIDYNTLRAVPYFGADAPIVMYELQTE